MSKLVAINLGSGDLQKGFPNVTAQISQAVGDRYPIKCMGSLPPSPELEQLHRHWQLLYREFYRERSFPSTRTIAITSGGVTHFSEVEFSDLGQQLKQQLNAWLNSESFHSIDRKLSRELDPGDEIHVIIETNDFCLRRLPWHLWNFFEDYPKAELALSVQEYGRVKPQSQTSVGTVRILAILGNSDGIETQADRRLLEKLPGATLLFLEEPSLQELNDYLWDSKGWDILFFAGHSQTEADTGRIHVNQTESLTLDQFRYALKQAISRGLKLAIFNSCDGLGLAQSLADLHIPQVIVMRELVPDLVAQEFFRHFLIAFSKGQSLYATVREARERLEKLEGDYPYATWLPVICQNPAEVLTTWQTLRDPPLNDRAVRHRKHRFPILLLTSIVITALVMEVRQLRILERWELQAFDQLMRLRPTEPLDPRLLIVTVTEQDVQRQNPNERRGTSLSDRTLTQLLEKLQPHHPRVIGLDIYRDFPTDPNYAVLDTHLRQNERFIAICEVGETQENPGTRPPPGIPNQRLSFSDIPVDPDSVVRRQILGMAPNPNSFCVTDTSFSLQIARFYLAVDGIYAQRNSQGTLQMGSILFRRLEPGTGSYHQLDSQGYQILLNYRSSGVAAKQVTLTELLNGSLDDELPNLVKDRIVLIGTTAQSFKDFSPTPYSTNPEEKMPGVLIQAHMVSQILSAVLDQRPLLWWLPSWGTTLWVWGWSLAGGVLVASVRSPFYLALTSGVAFGMLYGICFIVLLKGGWLPFIPAALGLATTEVGVILYTTYQNRKLQ
ncbi:MAG: CHASE2 domain-containing protein [Cyanobacteria bacterium CRU_2_1]|nr:CHASE2 domain-containing protein [Cyanobacteria bacterium RU_5_0]NJR61644.1 CHASE2 domain-containing protein [Cyanobacteria bacterium CRU_2_1]